MFFSCETLEFEQASREDIAFFEEVAKQTGGPVIDLGCGTGRLALALAGCGLDVVGLDISQNVLQTFHKKLQHHPAGLARRVNLLQADMTRFSL